MSYTVFFSGRGVERKFSFQSCLGRTRNIYKLLRFEKKNLKKEKGKSKTGTKEKSSILLEYRLPSLTPAKCFQSAVFCPEWVTGRPHLSYLPWANPRTSQELWKGFCWLGNQEVGLDPWSWLLFWQNSYVSLPTDSPNLSSFSSRQTKPHVLASFLIHYRNGMDFWTTEFGQK